MFKCLFIFSLFVSFSATIFAQEERTYVFKSGLSFKASSLFEVNLKPNAVEILTPEKDLEIHVFEFEKLQKFSAIEMLKTLKKDFNYPVFSKRNPPNQDQWTQISVTNFDIPSLEDKFCQVVEQSFKEKKYLIIIYGSVKTLSKRGAQISSIVGSLKPKDYIDLDYSKIASVEFSKNESVELERFIQKLMVEFKVPGLSISLSKDHKIVFEKYFGYEDIVTKKKVSKNTHFMIGSTTKPLTTLMQAKLVDLKKLEWDTKIKEINPEFKLGDSGAGSELKLFHTACACTGMPRRDLEFIFNYENVTAKQRMDELATLNPTTKLGETFQYSNHLVAAGGYYAALVYKKDEDLNKSYHEAMTNLVFKPLHMNETFTFIDPNMYLDLATPHSYDFAGKLVSFDQKIEGGVYTVSPAGSIWSTTNDLLKYLNFELEVGKDIDQKQYISKDNLLKRRVPNVKLGEKYSYGLGLFIENLNGISIYGHGGNNVGFTSMAEFIPKDKIAYSVLTNLGSANIITDLIRDKIIELFYKIDLKIIDLKKYALKKRADSLARSHKLQSENKAFKNRLGEVVGHYNSKNLGPLVIKKIKDKFFMDVGEWSSELMMIKEKDGNFLISTISPPMIGFDLEMKGNPVEKLILKSGQNTYEFLKVE